MSENNTTQFIKEVTPKAALHFGVVGTSTALTLIVVALAGMVLHSCGPVAHAEKTRSPVWAAATTTNPK